MTDLVGMHGAPDALASASQTFLLDVWKVDPQYAGRHIQQLTTLFDEISDQPGFVSARILESADRSSIGAVVEASSVEARRDLEQLPQVQNVLDQLHAGVGVVCQSNHGVTAHDGRGSDPGGTGGIGTRMIKRLPSPSAVRGVSATTGTYARSDAPATIGDRLHEILPLLDFVPEAGPPVLFVLGPWLLLVLMLIGPVVLLATLAFATVIFVAIPALICLVPYLVVRHARSR